MEEILKVEGLTKTFKQPVKLFKKQTGPKFITAVNDLSFTAYKGEIFGLLGPNGAGKTTTLRMLATLIKPDGGNAFIDGKSILTEESEVRKKIGFLTGELKLEETFTPSYLFDFFSDLYGVEKSVKEERKARLFKKFGIDGFAGQKLGNLST
ncbi:MAG: ABC transporter ATP-binding protein, partial [Clostridia bacterium]|nr:ABC transporter ATP-binding protein [Clostridia bacterium]